MADSDSDDDVLFAIWNKQTHFLISAAAAATSSHDDMEATVQQSVNGSEGVRDVLARLVATPVIFKRLTNFSVDEFNELCNKLVPVLDMTARSTGDLIKGAGRPPKLSAQQRILNTLMYLKHDNTVHFEAFQWNWSKSSLSDDVLFVCSVINTVLAHEICWPDVNERSALAQRIPEFRGCIGFIDGTLCKIRRPINNPDHRRWFNGRKKIYAMNSTVVIDHDGLIIFVDPGYPGSFHDVTILRNSDLHANWRNYFTHTDETMEYLLGDPGYSGSDMFIMRRVGVHEIPLGANAGAIHAYNAMHAGRRIKVEWGIGGLKCKFRRFLKPFDNTRPRFNHMFISAAILTNFLQRRRMVLEFADMGIYQGDPGGDGDNYGWHELEEM